MAAMRKDRENLSDRAIDAATGYFVVVLAILCLIVGFAMLVAIVRFLVGLS